MRLGMIGLGKMGGNMARRLMKFGHEPVVYDINAEKVKSFESEGVTGANSIKILSKGKW